MPKKKKIEYIINFIGILAVFAILVLLLDTSLLGRQVNYIRGIIIISMVTIIMVTSLNLVTGFMGEFSLGHAGFMSIGAYSSAVVTLMLDDKGIPGIVLFVIAIFIGGIASGIIGFLVGIPALRLRGDYLAIVTIAVAEIVRVAFCNFPATGGGKTLSGISKVSDVHLVFIVMVISVCIMYMFVRSRFGRVVTAIREDYIAASASGINVTKYKIMTFTISALFAGVAGAIYAHYMTAMIPNTFSFMKSAEYLTMAILGGAGSLTGSIIGAAVLSALPEMLRDFSIYRMLAYSVVLVLIMIFRPSGIFGKYEFSLPRVLGKLIRKIKGGNNHGQ